MFKGLLVVVCGVLLSGCGTFNFANTVAGGKCGKVNYSIEFMGQSLIGVSGDRTCVEEPAE